MLLTKVKYAFANRKTEYIVFRWICIGMLACCAVEQATGQLTAFNSNGKVATLYTNAYGNRDTIFVFNQTPESKTGNLSLQLSDRNTFKWYRFDYKDDVINFENQPFDVIADATETSKTGLEQGGYKVTVTPQGATAPRDSFIAWLYINPGFSFNLDKDDNGELWWYNKSCSFTNFILSPLTIQSSFKYYQPGRIPPVVLTFENRITFVMKPENNSEMTVLLNTQGSTQYLRDNSPPYEDTRYRFKAEDMFGIEHEDNIMYRTIIPFVIVNEPVLPETDPKSAPVPVGFTYIPHNVKEYIWRFGDGDSIQYDIELLPPDTVKHTYYTPRSQGYLVELKVTSHWDCTYTTDRIKITVDPPSLDVPNVFTPNHDQMNDFFKPNATSLRRFEIWIYTRTGKLVYHYKGDDLRSWEGWNGRIQNTGRDAAEGVYFYIIKAYGWDEPPTKNPQTGPYKGSFHLYR